MEIDARRALERWIHARRATLERIAIRGTWLDADDVSRLLRLSLPGIDELAALFEIARFASTGRYDLMVVDTAPTGHTLRMLALPDTLRAVARVFDDMQSKHRVMVEALRGRWSPDAEDAIIAEIDGDARELRELLRDPARVRMSWVTLAEPMAIAETADAAAVLAADGIALPEAIVNRVTPERERECGWCDRRRAMESAAAADVRKRLPGLALIRVMARPTEPRGMVALAEIGREIQQARPPLAARTPGPRGRWRASVAGGAAVDPGSLVALDCARLVLFGGKGGVGKTTCAAAMSIAVARRISPRQVVIVSTDPAHSLADAFGSPLSAVPSVIPGAPSNLRARELDAAAGFRAVRTRYAEAVDALFDRLSRGDGTVGFDVGHDRRVMQGLIDLAPPGIDELAAVIDVTDTVASRPEEIVIMDTAPSGHALRLLEMPALVQDWTKALMSIVLKYQPVLGVGEFGATLLKLSQGLGRLRALLVDPNRAAFVVVTRAAALPRAETLRLLARLRAMRIHVPAVIINAAGRGDCRACRAEESAGQREIATLRRRLAAGVQTVIAPAQLPPPHAAAALRRWYEEWRSNDRSAPSPAGRRRVAFRH